MSGSLNQQNKHITSKIATLDSSSIAAAIRKTLFANTFDAGQTSDARGYKGAAVKYAHAIANLLTEADRAAFLRACGVAA